MATAPAAPPKNRTFSAQVSDLLSALFTGLAPRGKVFVTAGRGTSSQEFSFWPYEPLDIWPPWLTKELKYDPPDDLRLCPATLDEAGSRLRDTRVVWAEVPLPPTFDGRTSRGWHVPQDVETRAFEKIESFPLQPSLVVDQGWSLFCGFLLDAPAALDSPAVLHRVEVIQRGLAEALGGITGDVTTVLPRRSARRPGEVVPVEMLPGWSPARRALRVPSSRNHDAGGREGGRVFLKFMDESQRYSLEQIEDALKAGEPGGRK